MAFETPADGNYDTLFAHFDAPVMRRVREEAYGEDIGQHSWVLADDLRNDVGRLRLSASSVLADLGCGPCGPLVFVVESVGCRGVGFEVSAPALLAARSRISGHGVDRAIELVKADLDATLPYPDGSFSAAMSFDVVVHLSHREATFREVARTLQPGGRFLFTDAAVIGGVISSEQVRVRSTHGVMQFCAPGFNEGCLERAGFRLLETEDRTQRVVECAGGRLAARRAHANELMQLEGADYFKREQLYLETVIRQASSRTLTRVMYLAEVTAGPSSR